MSTLFKILIMFMLISHQSLFAQRASPDNPQDGHFTGSLSVGPNYYFNNIKTFGDNVRPINYSLFGRIMWNSRYLVSLGIETGYNRFYHLSGFENNALRASLAAIPMHLVIGMRFAKSFYGNFSFGPSLLVNTASIATQENTLVNKVWSLADGSLCLGYRKRLSKDFTIGAELKLSFATKAADINLALPIVFSYDF